MRGDQLEVSVVEAERLRLSRLVSVAVSSEDISGSLVQTQLTLGKGASRSRRRVARRRHQVFLGQRDFTSED